MSFRHLSARASVALTAALILLIGFLDWWTGVEVSFSIFYVVPLAFATWRLGRAQGVFTALASAVAWLIAELYGDISPHLSIALLNMMVRYAFFHLIVHLIATRQVAEEELRKARDLAEQATRTKDEFLLKVNHELRTPLTSILGFSARMRRNERRNLEEVDLLCLDRIQQNGVDLLRMVNELLDLGRASAPGVTVHNADVDAVELIRGLVASVQADRRAPPGRLRIHAPASLLPIRTDPQKLRRIVSNLVVNALKHTDTGEITVAVVADPETHSAGRIDVHDTGVGISADQLPRLFEPFYQLDERVSSRMGGGVGLGLAICKELCHLLGFGLAVASQPGQGSTFSVLLSRTAGLPEAACVVLPARVEWAALASSPRT
jgi:signal transduction histidine kinase